ncbi:MAG: AbrB/MazE/SpoVT family DNA-binding domain-containing protein [Desulfurococcaceae archaeon]|mgnify:CR=1 FL=1
MSVEVRKVIRVGKQSSAIVVPSTWMKQLGLNPGDQVKLIYDGNRVIMTPVKESELLRGQIMVEGSDKVAFTKLKAAFMEGIVNIKLKAEYEEAVKLLTELKKEVPSVLFVTRPDAKYHTVIFPDIGVEHGDLIAKLCEVFKKIVRRDGELSVLLSDFKYTQLLLMRLLKIKYYEDTINVPEALDLVLFTNTLSEIVDSIVNGGLEITEEIEDALSILVEQYCSSDLDTAVKIGSNTIVKVDKFPHEIQKHVLNLVELIFRRCIRDKACRCRHFFPKI